MANIAINELKARFATLDQPTQKDYTDLIDTLIAKINATAGNLTPGGAFFYATAVLTGGTTYIASYPVTVTAYQDGTVLAFKADVINPSGSTQFDAGNGAALIKKNNGTIDLAAGDIQAGQIVEVRYDGSHGIWQMMTTAFRHGHKAGDIVASAFPLAEDGTRLLCDGRPVALATYPGLTPLTTGGGIFGATSAGNVLLPDMRRHFPVGVGLAGLGPGGAVDINLGSKTSTTNEVVTLTSSQMPQHQHSGPAQYFTPVERGVADTQVYATANHGDGTAALLATGLTGGGLSHNNLPPYVGLYFYILV